MDYSQLSSQTAVEKLECAESVIKERKTRRTAIVGFKKVCCYQLCNIHLRYNVVVVFFSAACTVCMVSVYVILWIYGWVTSLFVCCGSRRVDFLLHNDPNVLIFFKDPIVKFCGYYNVN